MEVAELKHQVRRLSPHPCIAIHDSANEVGAGGIFDSFIATTHATEDPSRPVWPACPAAGWASGVDRLTGLPNGRPLHVLTGAEEADDSVFQAVWGRAASEALSPDATCQFANGLDYDKGELWCELHVPIRERPRLR